MLAKHSRHIALTETLAAWIYNQGTKGEYASASDLTRTATQALRSRVEGEAIGQVAHRSPASPSRRRG
jgi:antitoxin ParD1/3/4